MNVENTRKLIEHLGSEECPIGFGMRYWFTHNGSHLEWDRIEEVVETHACGTVACLAGHAAYLALRDPEFTMPRVVPEDLDLGTIFGVAKSWMGLDRSAARHLFLGRWAEGIIDGYGFGGKRPLGEVTLAEAIGRLEYLVEREVET